jgi:hypothetical protein
LEGIKVNPVLLTPLAVTSITNFILACEAFFVCGLLWARPKAPRSAAWFWQMAMLALATTALVGGIDHGFFEVFGQIPVRKVIEHTNWFIIGLVTFFVFLTTARQFFEPPGRTYAYAVAGVQLVVYTVLILFVDNFLVVMVNYTPVMLLLLVLSSLGSKRGTGSWPLIAGILLSFAASAVQAAGVDVFSPFDRNSLYHFGMMAAVACFYFAALKWQADR